MRFFSIPNDDGAMAPNKIAAAKVIYCFYSKKKSSLEQIIVTLFHMFCLFYAMQEKKLIMHGKCSFAWKFSESLRYIIENVLIDSGN